MKHLIVALFLAASLSAIGQDRVDLRLPPVIAEQDVWKSQRNAALTITGLTMIAMINTWESPGYSFGLFVIGIGGTFTLHRASRRNKLIHQ